MVRPMLKSLTMLACAAWLLAAASQPDSQKFSFTGTLTTGVTAVGGETTGIEISDGKTRFELDIKDAALKKKADELNGKQVTVTGTLTIKQGVESGQRRIIAVDSLDAAKPVAATTRP